MIFLCLILLSLYQCRHPYFNINVTLAKMVGLATGLEKKQERLLSMCLQVQDMLLTLLGMFLRLGKPWIQLLLQMLLEHSQILQRKEMLYCEKNLIMLLSVSHRWSESHNKTTYINNVFSCHVSFVVLMKAQVLLYELHPYANHRRTKLLMFVYMKKLQISVRKHYSKIILNCIMSVINLIWLCDDMNNNEKTSFF